MNLEGITYSDSSGEPFGDYGMVMLRVDGIGDVAGWVEQVSDRHGDVRMIVCVDATKHDQDQHTGAYPLHIARERVIAWRFTDLDEVAGGRSITKPAP